MKNPLAEAVRQYHADHLDTADRICRGIISRPGKHAEALHLSAAISLRQGELVRAEQDVRRAIEESPGRANYYNTLGVVLRRQGKMEQARICYEQCLKHTPEDADAAYNLANLLKDQGELKQAGDLYRQVLIWQPKHASARLNLGYLLHRQGDLYEAESCFREGLLHGEMAPRFLLGLGLVLAGQQRHEEAEQCFRQLLRIQPLNADAHFYLGNALHARGLISDAEVNHRRCLELKPNFARAWNNLGNDLRDQGRQAEAEVCFRQALTIDPGHMRAHSNLLFLQHCFRDDGLAILQEHRRWTSAHAEPLYPVRAIFSNDSDPGRKLRIGYVSPDFCHHSVAFFLESVLAHHDADQVYVIAYADVAKEDDMTACLRSRVHAWRNIAFLNDEQVAVKVREDQVDILVDLAGHTGFHRLLVFARRPAPVQVTYLGYPATTGLATMDYRLTDAVSDPDGAEQFASECVFRLPRCFLAFTPPTDAPEVSLLPALKNGHITFGSFNHMAKITPEVIALWSAILKQVAQSRMILKHFSLQDEGTGRRYIEMFRQHGIDATRIDLLSWSPNSDAHLQCYARVDIALDPYPYNGTTTTCEALWMGVPVITLAGSTHAGRVGASVLASLGMNHWVVDSEDTYVDLAADMAAKPECLVKLRAGQRERMAASPLCDGEAMAHALEEAYRSMWQTWCKDNRSRN